MRFNLLKKETSRREKIRGSATLAGSAFLAHLFPATLLRVSYAQQAPSAADLVASMRARFNAAPIQTQKLADNLTMLSGPGGSVVVLNGPDGKSFSCKANSHSSIQLSLLSQTIMVPLRAQN